jgi:hypothetical protein
VQADKWTSNCQFKRTQLRNWACGQILSRFRSSVQLDCGPCHATPGIAAEFLSQGYSIVTASSSVSTTTANTPPPLQLSTQVVKGLLKYHVKWTCVLLPVTLRRLPQRPVQVDWEVQTELAIYQQEWTRLSVTVDHHVQPTSDQMMYF